MLPPDAGANQYIIDIEDAAETARLIDQDTLFTQAMGGLMPERTDLSQITSLLDLACGPGGWALEVAFAHPHIQVMGIDLSSTMVSYANARARSQRIGNATFEIMDILQPLAFSDQAIDLVNARFTVSFQSPQTWPRLLTECKRILKPGGMLRLTECEVGISNSAVYQQLNSYLYMALHDQHRTYSVDGQSVGITHMLARLLREAGFKPRGTRPFVLDASSGEPFHYQMSKEVDVTYTLLKPYLVQTGMLTAAAFDDLHRQVLISMGQPEFVCLLYGLTAYGYVPET